MVASFHAAGKLVLGTAQFGASYGVTNRRGRIVEGEIRQILARAQAAGVGTLDTAAAYGMSETVLGRCLGEFPALAVITKTPGFPGDAIAADVADQLRRGLESSLGRLGRPKVDGLLLHHGSDVRKQGSDRLIAGLAALKSAGLAGRIGVSVYDGDELDAVLDRFRPDIVQLPLNLFDRRLIRSGHVSRLREAGIEIHARSIFLQGLLLADENSRPLQFARFRPQFEKLDEMLRRTGLTPLEACLAFAIRQSGADKVVVGVSGLDDLEQILASLATMPHEDLRDIEDLAACDAALIDPRRWAAAS